MTRDTSPSAGVISDESVTRLTWNAHVRGAIAERVTAQQERYSAMEAEACLDDVATRIQAISTEVLGGAHPLTRLCDVSWVDGIPVYLRDNGRLVRDTIARWGENLGLSDGEESILGRAARHDAPVFAMTGLLQILLAHSTPSIDWRDQSGTIEAFDLDAKTPVALRLRHFDIHCVLPKNQIFYTRQKPGVPWRTVYVPPSWKMIEDREIDTNGLELLDALFRFDPDLPDDLRRTLASVRYVFAQSTDMDTYLASILDSRDRAGMLILPVGNTLPTSESGRTQFSRRFCATMIQEAQHVADMQNFCGMLTSSVILEARGHAREAEYIDRKGWDNSEFDYVWDSLDYYGRLLRGEGLDDYSHVSELYTNLATYSLVEQDQETVETILELF